MMQSLSILSIILAVYYGLAQIDCYRILNECNRAGRLKPEPYSFSLDEQASGDGNIQIDAFNEEICGQSSKREWQEMESAFSCKSGGANLLRRYRANVTNTPPPDVFINGGEFPFAAQINAKTRRGGYEGTCSGTLIHKNLVLTEARCFYFQQTAKPTWTVTIGSVYGDGRDGYEFGVENACYLKGPDEKHTGRNKLTLVKLSRDVDYFPGKIQPACLRLETRHDSNAKCTISGGRGMAEPWSTRMLTYNFKRKQCADFDSESELGCYDQVDKFQRPTNNDEGGSLYCFDNCGGEGQLAYAVGMYSGSRFEKSSKNRTETVLDYSVMSNEIHQLIARIALGGKRGDQMKCLVD